MMLILLLYKWCICTASSSSDELAQPPIARKNCESLCGDVSIPYPFGIGIPNNHCYFDEWYEIECNISGNGEKPFLRRLQVEVLSISTDDATLQVMSPITYFNCRGKQSPPVANLMGSPFEYSAVNIFVAVSCGLFASVLSGPNNTTVAGCMSTCAPSFPYFCNYGINCCQTTLPPSVTTSNFSAVMQQEDERRGNNATDCKVYAFLVDGEWFDKTHNSTSGFSLTDIEGKDMVPIKLDWSLSLENNTSLIKLFEGFTSDIDTSRRSPNDSTPSCFRYIDALVNQTRYQCNCPPGFEGNPYLLQPCQGTPF